VKHDQRQAGVVAYTQATTKQNKWRDSTSFGRME
jgi:hypothetical protein